MCRIDRPLDQQAIYLLTEADINDIERVLAHASMSLDSIILKRCIPPGDPDDSRHCALFAVADALLTECFDAATESCF